MVVEGQSHGRAGRSLLSTACLSGLRSFLKGQSASAAENMTLRQQLSAVLPVDGGSVPNRTAPWIYGATAQPACVTSLAGLPAEACRAKAGAGIQPAASDVMAIMKPGSVKLVLKALARH